MVGVNGAGDCDSRELLRAIELAPEGGWVKLAVQRADVSRIAKKKLVKIMQTLAFASRVREGPPPRPSSAHNAPPPVLDLPSDYSSDSDESSPEILARRAHRRAAAEAAAVEAARRRKNEAAIRGIHEREERWVAGELAAGRDGRGEEPAREDSRPDTAGSMGTGSFVTEESGGVHQHSDVSFGGGLDAPPMPAGFELDAPGVCWGTFGRLSWLSFGADGGVLEAKKIHCNEPWCFPNRAIIVPFGSNPFLTTRGITMTP